MTNIIKESKLIAVYGRTSTSLQEDQKTIEAQLLEVQKFAEEHGYIIIKEYLDEGWSGDVLVRPALTQLRLDARKKMWEAVLIYDPDRLGRRYFYQELVMDELKQLGVDTLFVTVPPVKDINDRMLGGVRGLFAEYERAKISERFRIGKLNRLDKGDILLSEAPYGYKYIPNVGKRGTAEYSAGHLVINEDESKNVIDIFTWVADDGLTLRGIVKRLQERGISPRKSKRGVWNTSTLSSLLRNKSYIGQAFWGASYAVVPEKPLKIQEFKKNKKTSRRMRPVNEWKPISVPRVLEDEDLFNRAGQRLRDNFALMGRNKKNDYMLAGKIFCTCGCRRAGEGPQHGKHLYYRCNDRVNCFPLPRKCYEKGINARIADSLVWQRIEQIMQSPELLKAQTERWKKEQHNNDTNKHVVDIASLKKELLKLEEKEERFSTAYSEKVITLEKLREYLVPIQASIEIVKRKLIQASSDQQLKVDVSLPNEEEIESFSKEVMKHKDSLSFEAKKGIIHKSLNKVYSNQKSIQVYGAFNLHELYVSFFLNNSDSKDTNLTKNYVNSLTSDRNRRSSKRWKINIIQRYYQ